MNVIILGYMGCGKSTIAKILSEVLQYECIDLDKYIEEQEQCSVKTMFETKGELYFRTKEQLYLKTLLDEASNKVIALGGGTPCYYDNMKVITSSTTSKSFYINTSINELCKRLFTEKSKRPLIAHIETKEALMEYIGKHLFERSVYYSQADEIIKGNNTPNEISKAIIAKLF